MSEGLYSSCLQAEHGAVQPCRFAGFQLARNHNNFLCVNRGKAFAFTAGTDTCNSSVDHIIVLYWYGRRSDIPGLPEIRPSTYAWRSLALIKHLILQPHYSITLYTLKTSQWSLGLPTLPTEETSFPAIRLSAAHWGRDQRSNQASQTVKPQPSQACKRDNWAVLSLSRVLGRSSTSPLIRPR